MRFISEQQVLSRALDPDFAGSIGQGANAGIILNHTEARFEPYQLDEHTPVFLVRGTSKA